MVKSEYLTENEFRSTQRAILAAAKTVEGLPLWQYISTLDRADADAPLISPALYRAGMRKASAMRDLASAAKAMQQKYKELVALSDAALKGERPW